MCGRAQALREWFVFGSRISTHEGTPMPDETPKPPVVVPNADSPASAASTPPQNIPSGPTINIADEFGTAKRNLPPAATVLITLLGVLVAGAGSLFLPRAQTPSACSL